MDFYRPWQHHTKRQARMTPSTAALHRDSARAARELRKFGAYMTPADVRYGVRNLLKERRAAA
jgi:hypothetical protein